MAFEFLRELLEAQPTPIPAPGPAGGGHPLTNDAGFNALAKVAPNFAQKLMEAWNGDAREYQRTQGKGGELLFPQMLKNISKYLPKLPTTPQVQALIQRLTQMHASMFPARAQNARTDTSVWQHEPWAKESLEADSEEYDLLREEFEELTQDR